MENEDKNNLCFQGVTETTIIYVTIYQHNIF